MDIVIRQAVPADSTSIVDILLEAARWLDRCGASMWREDELQPQHIVTGIAEGLFFVAEKNGEAIGTLKFQCSDPVFWPDVPVEDSAFVHRLAVRRDFSGSVVSSSMLRWAAERAHELGRQYLRLDCEASRHRLRAVYERFGFRHHSDRQVGCYYVARYELPLPFRPDESGRFAGAVQPRKRPICSCLRK